MRILFRFLSLHARKLGVMCLNLMLGHNLAYRAMGVACRWLSRKPVKGVFMLYPANLRYARSYVYDWYRRSMQWKPRLVGVIVQNGRLIPYFGISATNDDLRADVADGGSRLRAVDRRMQEIAQLLGAEQRTYAGIIPSLLASMAVPRAEVERRTTVVAIKEALLHVLREEEYPAATPILVLGGRGYIGEELSEALKSSHPGSLDQVDVNERTAFEEWADALRGCPAILINVSREGAIRDYVSSFWPQLVVLNEVYPEPSREELEFIKSVGARCYHVVGVQGRAWPPFPAAYAGGIPCCASHLPADSEGTYRVVVAAQ